MILNCIFRLFHVVLKFYYCIFIFIRLFKCNSLWKFCKLFFLDTGPLWRPALELNGLPCVNKVLLYFTLLHFTSLHFTSLHFTSLHFTLLYFTLLYFTLLYFTEALLTYLGTFSLWVSPLLKEEHLRRHDLKNIGKFWRPTGLITFVFWSCREFSKPMTLLWLKSQEYVMCDSYLIGCPFSDREYEIIDLRKWEGTIKWNKLVFYLCLYNKQNIIWPLGDTENFSSRVDKYCNTQRFSAQPCNILCVK